MEPAFKKPKAVKPGAAVAVVAASSPVRGDYLEKGVAALENLGYRVRLSKSVLERDGIFAGADQVRARALQQALEDPEIEAVFAARGGYGAGRILPLLDFGQLASRPKVFVGFSDATYILSALLSRAGVVCFHGPMVAMDFARGLDPEALAHLGKVLAGGAAPFELRAAEVISGGVASGVLVGGCLSVIVATLGTPYAPPFRANVLFLEDVGERAYRIDRMLVQLRHSGVLREVAALVFGSLTGPEGCEREEQERIRRFVVEQTADLGIPVLNGIEAGHRTRNFTLPLGVRVEVDAEVGSLRILEDGVQTESA